MPIAALPRRARLAAAATLPLPARLSAQGTWPHRPVRPPAIRAVTLTAMVVTPRRRLPGRPEVPSIAEVAAAVDFEHAWRGVFGPAGVPGEAAARIPADTRAALARPDVVARLPAGAGLFDPGPEAPAARMRTDHAGFGALVAGLGLPAA